MVANRIALLHAADCGDLARVTELVDVGGVGVNEQWKKKDGRGYNPLATPIHYAARSGHLDVVKFLVDRGADINARDIENWTALHYSCNNGHVEIVEYLISKGIDTTPKDSFYNQTAIEFASYRQFDDVVRAIDPNYPVKARNASDINKNGIKSVYSRNSKNFLFRYLFKEPNAEEKLMAFRNDPAHAPLILPAQDSELDERDVILIFNHDFQAHRTKAQEVRVEGKFLRASTISTNEHIIIASDTTNL
eukprot:Phypoly_transcript_11831.p1 GENE.Phypoly_transcript_11831~~Phypoly_transcript_11831.p1  ORF type:complete len:249 (+),score=33.50 Phypoly_transcript_11831:333-1079(+)